MTPLASMSPAEHRLLLIASIAVVDSASMLLTAAAIDIDMVLNGGSAEHLVLDAGTFRFIDPRVRAIVHATASPAEHSDAHHALAHTLRSLGHPALAAWHASLAHPQRSAELQRALLGLGGRRLERGDAVSAAVIGAFVTRHAEGSTQLRGAVLAGRAALWAGQFDDSLAAFRLVLADDSPEHRQTATAHLKVLESLREGPPDGDDMRTRAIKHTEMLLPVTATRVDEDAMGQLLDICWTMQRGDYDEGDAMQARLYLGALPTPKPWPWTTGSAALTPFAEAHLVHLQVAFQLQANDFSGAVSTLQDGLQRLPLTLASAGLTSSFIRRLAPHSPHLDLSIADTIDALAPRNQLDYHAPDRPTGARSAAASRHRSRHSTEIEISEFRRLLTSRELQIARLVTTGLSNKTIALQLDRSLRTVEVHLTNIYRKTGLHSRAAVIAHAVRYLL
ncbi:response regulator transcription factor [Plantibacter sp. YIM 135347]|uniref:helix-turn-helix transcriptional regulator n=1 Tax=Plantibacter sp. YIM 135347 TaxID=3423919 RepID=UPI003D33B699